MTGSALLNGFYSPNKVPSVRQGSFSRTLRRLPIYFLLRLVDSRTMSSVSSIIC